MNRIAAACALVALATVGCATGRGGGRSAGSPPPPIEFLGAAEFPSGFEFGGTVVGGLSGLTRDAGRGLYYAISDDPAERGPARFYTLRVDLGDGRLDPGDVTFAAVTPLLDGDGRPFATGSIDAEGIALVHSAAGESLYISSEGKVDHGVPPFVRRFDLSGHPQGSLPLPATYLPGGEGADATGVRHNLAFESLTVTPGGAYLVTATENALAQDGPAADLGTGSPSRILVFDLTTGVPAAEYVYPVEPVAPAPQPSDGFRVNGLVEMLALGRTDLLALERAFSVGGGYAIRLCRVSLAGATDVFGRPSLAGLDVRVRTVSKSQLFDFAELPTRHGIALDNLEGLALGPPLADGRRTLLVVSDDNFSRDQRTLFLAFALAPVPP